MKVNDGNAFQTGRAHGLYLEQALGKVRGVQREKALLRSVLVPLQLYMMTACACWCWGVCVATACM